MDPHAMLEAVKSVLSLELADRVIPEISDSGEIVVPFLNAPKGIAAELTISRSKYYGNVLGLRIVMESAEGPYYFDGTYRNEAECTIRAYGDPVNGGLATLGFMTNLEPAPGPGSSWAYLAKASFNQGLLYNINADGAPMSAMMNACGYKDGQSATWDVPITLDSSVSSADASEFATRMKSIYQNLRDQRRDK